MYLERANDLDVFEDKIYWCDQESESILSIDKFNPKSTLNVLVKDLKNVLSSKIVHYSKQNASIDNLCAKSDCEFLCMPRNDLKSFKCACSDDSMLNEDRRTCQLNTKIETTKAITKDAKDSSSSFLRNMFDKNAYKANTNVIYLIALAIFLILLITVICFYLVINYYTKK